MQISAVPHSEVLAVHGQNGLPRNTQGSNQIQDVNAPTLNWKANPTCCNYGEKGHLAQECPHTGSSAAAQRQQTPIVNTQQANYTGPTSFPATNPTLFQTIIVETPVTSDI